MAHPLVVGAVGAVTALILLASATASAHDEPRPRLIVVGGQGEVRAAPDRADVGLTVEASEKVLATAEQGVRDGIARLLKLCDDLGIPKANVRSAQVSVQPQYDYSSGNRPRILGYIVSRHVEVDLRDLTKLGRLMQGAFEAGANRISGPTFGSTRKDEHERAALSKAAEDARANAETVARTLDVKLGGLHSLSASEGGMQPPQPMVYATRMKAEAAQDGAQSYEAGEMQFSASVTAEFDLE